MNASSESGLWAQTISLTAEVVIGVKKHYIIRSQGSNTVQTEPRGVLTEQLFQRGVQLAEAVNQIVESRFRLVQLAAAAHNFETVGCFRCGLRAKIRYRTLQCVRCPFETLRIASPD